MHRAERYGNTLEMQDILRGIPWHHLATSGGAATLEGARQEGAAGGKANGEGTECAEANGKGAEAKLGAQGNEDRVGSLLGNRCKVDAWGCSRRCGLNLASAASSRTHGQGGLYRLCRR